MKMLRTTSFMVMALALSACNEKVSPELQDSNVVAPTPTAPVVEDSFTFRVTSESNAALQFMLHKTGNTFKPDPILTSDDCEVTKKIEPFKRSEFGKSQYNMVDPTDEDELYTVNDITCYLEAEELALYAEGLKFKVEATPGACKFVTYTPFSYYNRMPGNSSAIYKNITCADDTDNSHVTAAFAASPGSIAYGAGLSATCDEYLIDSRKASDGISNIPVLAADKTVFRVDADDETADLETEAQLCRYNYETLGKEKCDVGEIEIYSHNVRFNKSAAENAARPTAEATALTTNSLYGTYTDASDDDGAGPDDGAPALSTEEFEAIRGTTEFDLETDAEIAALILTPAYVTAHTTKTINKRTVNCSGKIMNCVEGPVKKHPELLAPSGGLISSIISSTDTYEKEYSYEKLNPTRGGTYVYANFRRELANSGIAYPINLEDPSDYTDFAALAYMNAFDPSGLNAKIFEPRVLDRYVSNRSYILAPTTNLVTSAAWELASLENSRYAARPYAAEAFLGIGSYKTLTNRTNPYYTFECLDNARETTARIRVLVREWDRLIPEDTSTAELVSDIAYGEVDAYQDNTHYNTFNTYEDEEYNDLLDWDDFMRMEWTPGPVITPVNGYFSSLSFPNEDRATNTP